jgi:hypothetical protein
VAGVRRPGRSASYGNRAVLNVNSISPIPSSMANPIRASASHVWCLAVIGCVPLLSNYLHRDERGDATMTDNRIGVSWSAGYTCWGYYRPSS